jgi:hypothetical protein
VARLLGLELDAVPADRLGPNEDPGPLTGRRRALARIPAPFD